VPASCQGRSCGMLHREHLLGGAHATAAAPSSRRARSAGKRGGAPAPPSAGRAGWPARRRPRGRTGVRPPAGSRAAAAAARAAWRAPAAGPRPRPPSRTGPPAAGAARHARWALRMQHPGLLCPSGLGWPGHAYRSLSSRVHACGPHMLCVAGAQPCSACCTMARSPNQPPYQHE